MAQGPVELGELKAEIAQLSTEAGLSVAAVSIGAGLSEDTVGRWMRTDTRPAPRALKEVEVFLDRSLGRATKLCDQLALISSASPTSNATLSASDEANFDADVELKRRYHALSDDEDRIKLAEAIARAGDENFAADCLREIALDGSSSSRDRATVALASLGEVAVERLLRILETSRHDSVRVSASQQLVRLGEDAVEGLVKILQTSQHIDVRVLAANGLTKLGHTEIARDYLHKDELKRRYLSVAHDDERMMLASLIASVDDKKFAADCLCEIALDGSSSSRVRATVALASLGEVAVEPLLRVLESSKHTDVRVSAGHGLIGVGHGEVVGASVGRLRAEKMTVGDNLRIAQLASALDDSEAAVAYAVAYIHGMTRRRKTAYHTTSREAVSILLKFSAATEIEDLFDRVDPQVAIDALLELGRHEFVRQQLAIALRNQQEFVPQLPAPQVRPTRKAKWRARRKERASPVIKTKPKKQNMDRWVHIRFLLDILKKIPQPKDELVMLAFDINSARGELALAELLEECERIDEAILMYSDILAGHYRDRAVQAAAGLLRLGHVEGLESRLHELVGRRSEESVRLHAATLLQQFDLDAARKTLSELADFSTSAEVRFSAREALSADSDSVDDR